MNGSIEKIFQENEKKLGLLSKGIIDALCVINLENLMYTYVSDSVQELFGYRADERINRNIQGCMTPESFQNVTKCLLKAMDGYDRNPEAKQTMEIEFYHKNGDTVWVEVTTRIVKDPNGSLKAIGFSRDINKRKKLEQEKERLIKEISASIEEQKRLKRENKILMGLLPICADCKKIRDKAGKWWALEEYISTRTEAKFSHTLCPDCFERTMDFINKIKIS